MSVPTQQLIDLLQASDAFIEKQNDASREAFFQALEQIKRGEAAASKWRLMRRAIILVSIPVIVALLLFLGSPIRDSFIITTSTSTATTTPTVTLTNTSTSTTTFTATFTEAATATDTLTSTETPTATPTLTFTATPTDTMTYTVTPTVRPLPIRKPRPTATVKRK